MATTQKCVHKGCGKVFTDPEEPCHYHPGPPEFHEGQKGWTCCKPRVLTFDEFLEIPPCSTGRHSTVDDTPAPAAPVMDDAAIDAAVAAAAPKPISAANPQDPNAPVPRGPQVRPAVTASPAAAAALKEEQKEDDADDSDDPDKPIPNEATCKRRGCGEKYAGSSGGGAARRAEGEEKCTYHPGQPIFHEGSKGWTCCKRRVLEFDEFMRILGCSTKPFHCFVGGMRKKRRKLASSSSSAAQNGVAAAGAGASAGDVDMDDGEKGEDEEEAGDGFEKLKTVRHDFYQTSSTVHASVFLKKIDKELSTVRFPDTGTEIELDLKTADKKRYTTTMPLYAGVDPAASVAKILGTKLELTLSKKEPGLGWPVLRADDKLTGEIIQTGRAGRA